MSQKISESLMLPANEHIPLPFSSVRSNLLGHGPEIIALTVSVYNQSEIVCEWLDGVEGPFPPSIRLGLLREDVGDVVCAGCAKDFAEMLDTLDATGSEAVA